MCCIIQNRHPFFLNAQNFFFAQSRHLGSSAKGDLGVNNFIWQCSSDALLGFKLPGPGLNVGQRSKLSLTWFSEHVVVWKVTKKLCTCEKFKFHWKVMTSSYQMLRFKLSFLFSLLQLLCKKSPNCQFVSYNTVTQLKISVLILKLYITISKLYWYLIFLLWISSICVLQAQNV